MSTNFVVIFDNGGGTTLQTARFVHHYEEGCDCAADVRRLIAGENTADWEGNEPIGRMSYNHDEERNGGYCWHYREDVLRIFANGILDDKEAWGRNCESFYRALGVATRDD